MLSHIIIVHFKLFFEGASKHIYLDLYCSSFQKRDISSQKKRLNIRTHCNSICHTDASSRSEIERVTYTRFGTKRERSAILNSKYALHVTSALVSQKICCLQAHDGVFTRRVQIHRRTYMHVHIYVCRKREVHLGFHVHPSESRLRGDAPLKCRHRASFASFRLPPSGPPPTRPPLQRPSRYTLFRIRMCV